MEETGITMISSNPAIYDFIVNVHGGSINKYKAWKKVTELVGA